MDVELARTDPLAKPAPTACPVRMVPLARPETLALPAQLRRSSPLGLHAFPSAQPAHQVHPEVPDRRELPETLVAPDNKLAVVAKDLPAHPDLTDSPAAQDRMVRPASPAHPDKLLKAQHRSVHPVPVVLLVVQADPDPPVVMASLVHPATKDHPVMPAVTEALALLAAPVVMENKAAAEARELAIIVESQEHRQATRRRPVALYVHSRSICLHDNVSIIRDLTIQLSVVWYLLKHILEKQ